MVPESYFCVPEAFSKPPDEKVLNFESVHLGKNWSKNRGNYGGSIEVSCQISLGVKEDRRRDVLLIMLDMSAASGHDILLHKLRPSSEMRGRCRNGSTAISKAGGPNSVSVLGPLGRTQNLWSEVSLKLLCRGLFRSAFTFHP